MTNSTGIVLFLLFLPLKVKQTNVNRNYLIIWHLELDTVSQEQTFPVPGCELSFMKQEHRDCISHRGRRVALGWLGQSQTAVPSEDFVKIWASLPSQTAFYLDAPHLMTQPHSLSPSPVSTLWKYRSCHWSTNSLCWSWQCILFGLRQLRISPPLLTPPEPSRGVWGVGFGFLKFFFCVQPTVGANTAGVMDKHTLRKREGQEKTWLAGCFTALRWWRGGARRQICTLPCWWNRK